MRRSQSKKIFRKFLEKFSLRKQNVHMYVCMYVFERKPIDNTFTYFLKFDLKFLKKLYSGSCLFVKIYLLL